MRSPLPVKDGVGATRLRVPVTGPWNTIADYVVGRFAHLDADILLDRFDRGDVAAADGSAISRTTPLGAEHFIWYYREPPVEREIPFEPEVLYADDDLVVVDKPHFLPTTPGGSFLQNSALVRLRTRLRNPQLTPIHRLDRATAGLLMFSPRAETRGAYQSLFEKRRVDKVYEAVSCVAASDIPTFPLVVRTHIEKIRGQVCVVQDPTREPNSETRVELISTSDAGEGQVRVHMRLHPHTGRMHQLRAHLGSIGLGIVGDRYYPVLRDEAPDDFDRPLQLLSRELRFVDPLSGAPREFITRRTLQLAAPA